MADQIGPELAVTVSMEDFSRMSGAWNDLLADSASDTVFLTWEWLYSWAETYLNGQRRLSIITIREGRDLIGIAPWYTRTIRKGPLSFRSIEVLGTPETGSDYLDVITRKGREKTVASILFDYLFKHSGGSWDILYLSEVPSGSTFLLFFLGELRTAGKHFEVEYGSYCPVVELPGTEEDFLRSLSSHRRQHLNRYLRILQKQGEVRFDRYTADKCDGILKKFQELYEKRWGKGKEEIFAFIHRYMKTVDGSKNVEIDVLKIGNDTIGGLTHIIYGNRKYQYLMAVDRSFNKNVSIGEVICQNYIKEAIAEGYDEYDFLKGDEPHKFVFANSARTSMNLSLFNRSFGGILTFSANRMRNLGKILLR